MKSQRCNNTLFEVYILICASFGLEAVSTGSYLFTIFLVVFEQFLSIPFSQEFQVEYVYKGGVVHPHKEIGNMGKPNECSIGHTTEGVVDTKAARWSVSVYTYQNYTAQHPNLQCRRQCTQRHRCQVSGMRILAVNSLKQLGQKPLDVASSGLCAVALRTHPVALVTTQKAIMPHRWMLQCFPDSQNSRIPEFQNP